MKNKKRSVKMSEELLQMLDRYVTNRKQTLEDVIWSLMDIRKIKPQDKNLVKERIKLAIEGTFRK